MEPNYYTIITCTLTLYYHRPWTTTLGIVWLTSMKSKHTTAGHVPLGRHLIEERTATRKGKALIGTV